MKRTISILLLCIGLVLIALGAYQVLGEDYKFWKSQYEAWMSIYEGSRLNAQTFTFDDLRQNASELASMAYKDALDSERRLEEYKTKAIIFGALGIICTTIGGISLLQKGNNVSGATQSYAQKSENL